MVGERGFEPPTPPGLELEMFIRINNLRIVIVVLQSRKTF
jgi:hypothetical protein